jgi:hypothetical protein
MSFSATGTFATATTQNVTLNGTGTPTATGVQTFTVTWGTSTPTSTCTFQVTVAAAAGPAVGTLGGGPSPGICTPATINGLYVVGVPVVAGNTVQVQANVTTVGSYTINTNTVAGISFSFTGTFAATGPQTVTLAATGTPSAAGVQTFTVTWGTSTPTSTCNFAIVVLPNDYFPRTTNSNWSYEFDDVTNDSLIRQVIAATHTANSNTYNIFMADDDGIGPLDSSGYYRRNGGDYFEYLDFGGFVGYDGPVWGEYNMLKDNVAAATNWKTPVTGFPGTYNGGTPINLRFSMTILQKDVPIAITTSTGTVTYQSVIVVEEKFEGEASPGVWVDATSLLGGYGKSYYARGVGLIKFEFLDAGGNVQSKQELRRFMIF